mmetsp:Transcript_10620/g.15636  ORF Transcript_10620/g.15636 Transcript_10620/m.15636 type:complete len:238 (+) Transcript_10620:40-753(+)
MFLTTYKTNYKAKEQHLSLTMAVTRINIKGGARLEKAIILNNKAVQNLETKNYNTSIQLLRRAITICQITNNDEPQTTEPVSFFQWSSRIGSLEKEGRGCFVFNRGVFIRSMATSTEIVKAVILYNTALVYHMFAKLDQNCDQHLQRAKLLYALSARILKKEQSQRLQLFHMAIMNNLSQVSYDMVDYQTSKKCLDQLQQNILHLHRTKKRTGFCPRDLMAMHFNTLVDVPMTAPCA